jgi:hypothetical protein
VTGDRLIPVKRILPTVYRLKKLKKKSGQGPTKSCRAIIIIMMIIIIIIIIIIIKEHEPED